MTLLCFLVEGGNNNKDRHGIMHAVQNVEEGERQDEQVLSQPQEQLDIITETPDQIEQVKSEEELASELQSNKTVVEATTEESSESDKDSNTEEVPWVSGQGVSCTVSSRDPSISAEDTAITAQNESWVSISDKNSSGSSRDLVKKTTHDKTHLPVTNVIATPSDQDFGENEKTGTMEKSEEVQELTMTQNDLDLNGMQATETSSDQDIADHEKPNTNQKSEEKQEETNSAAAIIIASNAAETIAEKSCSLDTELQVPDNQLKANGEASEPPGPSLNSNQSVNNKMDQRKFSPENSSTDIEVLTTYDLDQTDNFNQKNNALKQNLTEDTAAELQSEISIDENEQRLNSETGLPQFGSTSNETLLAEPIVQNTAQEKNFESVVSCAGPQQQEDSSDSHITVTVSHCGEKSQLLLKDLGSPSSITEAKNSETDAIDSMPSRDIDAENRLITALRLSCKLSPGHFVKALDVKGVMSVHLLRSLSPGVLTVAELVYKLVYLTDLDLSGNLLGPQGFRVICLALRTNTTLKCLNLANNLADTDSSVSTKTN